MVIFHILLYYFRIRFYRLDFALCFSKLEEAVAVFAFHATLGVEFVGFELNAQVRFADVEKLGVPTGHISEYISPRFRLQRRVPRRLVTQNNPRLCRFIDFRIRLTRLIGSYFVADRAQVVILTVIYYRPIFGFQTGL